MSLARNRRELSKLFSKPFDNTCAEERRFLSTHPLYRQIMRIYNKGEDSREFGGAGERDLAVWP